MIVKIDEKDKDNISGGLVYNSKKHGSYENGVWIRTYGVLDDETGKVLDSCWYEDEAKRSAKEHGQSTQMINRDEKELLFD